MSVIGATQQALACAARISARVKYNNERNSVNERFHIRKYGNVTFCSGGVLSQGLLI